MPSQRPTTVTVLMNQFEASFDVTSDPMATGSATVTATLAADMKSSTVTIGAINTNHIVISELATQGMISDAGSAANDEFVELYNPTPLPIDVSGWKIQYKSATGGTYANKAILPVSLVIPSHGYYLVASKSYSTQGSVPADLLLTNDMNFQGGSTGGHVRLGTQDVTTAKVDPEEVDRLGYGPTADFPEGFAAMASVPSGLASYERKATPGSTAASMAIGGTDATKGNGLDTDQNGDKTVDGGVALGDWVLRVTRDPQNSSNPAEP